MWNGVRMARKRTVTTTWTVDETDLDGHLAPRSDVVEEAEPTGPHEDRRYALATGPFRHYERRVQVCPDGDGRHRVTQTTTYQLGIGAWSPLFQLPVRRTLARPPGRSQALQGTVTARPGASRASSRRSRSCPSRASPRAFRCCARRSRARTSRHG